MEVENQTPLLNNGEKPAITNCCSGPGDDSSTRIVSVSSKVHHGCCGGCRQNHMLSNRQSSHDSGTGSLDPISEHTEYCACDEVKTGLEDANRCQNRRKSSPASPEHAPRLECTGRCGCSDSVLVLNGYSRHNLRQEETGFTTVNSLHAHRSPAPISENSCGHMCNGNAHYGSRNRRISGNLLDSTSSDDVFQNGITQCGRNDQVILKQVQSYSSNVGEMERGASSEGVREKSANTFCPFRCRTMLFFGILFVGLGAAAALGICSWRSSEMKKMDEKINLLEQAVAQMGKVPTSFAAITSVKSDSRPHVHLVLKVEDRIPLTRWNQRILQWSPFVGDSGGLKYDAKKRCLIAEDPGIYFVYNQIYVFRHVSESTRAMNSVSNHTMFHAIYNKPFNFPSDEKPVVVTESALSNCWNENADTQIHTSYQGIIVKLQHNDQLLVALEDYNDALDTLDPKSTFFGAFKL